MRVTIRLAEENDAERFVQWEIDTPNNCFAGEIENYPRLTTLAVDINGEPSLYVPFHPVIVVESLGHRPDITPRENAYALRKVQDVLESLARQTGIAEVWWQCQDKSLIKFAERHGYEVLHNAVTLRKKVLSNV